MVKFLTQLLRARVAGGLLLSSGTAYITVQSCSSTATTPISTTPPSSSHILPSLTLYQYQTCPFCSKARAFLDYHDINYKVVEVNPIFKREIKFSTNKKLPFIVTEDDTQLNDSSLIISVLKTCLLTGNSIATSLDMYPEMTHKDDKGKETKERLNKYFIMYGETPTDRMAELREERKWREWVDVKLVRCLSPNIYRTPREALEAMKLTTSVAKLNPLEKVFAKYIGAMGMYFIGRSMKKKYQLDDDVREELYRACNKWMKAIGRNRKFMGGDSPNLADLSVFGVLNAIEGLSAFDDVMASTAIKGWYYAVKETVVNRKGRNPISQS